MSLAKKLANGTRIIQEVGQSFEKVTSISEEQKEREHELNRTRRQSEPEKSTPERSAQIELNTIESKSGNIFVAGWRPAVGWIGAIGLFYQFVLYPLLLWLPVGHSPPPMDTSSLYALITGMLGIAGLRSYDKLKGIDTHKVAITNKANLAGKA